MADTYPWGNQAPAQRVAKLEASLRANEKKRLDAIEAHKRKIAEIDEADRLLKGDLKAAQNVVDREKREATTAAASKVLEKVIGTASVDVDEVIRSGEFEKIIQKALADAAALAAQDRKSAAKAKAPNAGEAAPAVEA